MNRNWLFKKASSISIFALFLVSLSTLAFAMGTQPPAPEPLPVGLSTDQHFSWGLYERYFDVYVPPGLNEPAPLVIEIHGLGSDKQAIRGYSGLFQKAEAEKFIIAWPQGIMNSWNGIVCCPPANGLGIDDVGFLKALVFWISERANVDLDRVYATGHSNGGAMCHQLGLRASDVFAAIAAVSFHLTDSSTIASPFRPVPVLEIHGMRDELVWFPWSPEFGCVEDGFHDWARIDGCSGKPVRVWENENGAFREAYLDCRGNVRVEWLVLNSGHYADGLYRDNVDGLDLAQEIWYFLSQWTLP